MKSVTRGAALKASELDKMISGTPTDCQYLMLANIQRGQIDDNLPYMKDVLIRPVRKPQRPPLCVEKRLFLAERVE